MLRQALMYKGLFLTDKEFKTVMETTTDDIKFNQILFKKKIKLNEVIEIATNCAKALKRCA